MTSLLGRLAAFLGIIIGIMVYMSVGANLFDKVRRSSIELELKNIDNQLQAVFFQSRRYPKDVGAFLAQQKRGINDRGSNKDPWGNDYRFESRPRGFILQSAGPDALFSTEDDIRLERDKKKMNIVYGAYGQKVAALASPSLAKTEGKKTSAKEDDALSRELDKIFSAQKSEKEIYQLPSELEMAELLYKLLGEKA